MTQQTEYISKVIWEEAACLFCGPNAEKEALFKIPDRKNGLPGLFTLARCKGCGLAFQDPRPTEETVQHVYPDTYQVYQPPPKEAEAIVGWKRTLSNLIFSNFFEYHHLAPSNPVLKLFLLPLYYYGFRDQTIPLFRKNGRLLEIGCAFGGRIERDRRRGWQVSGIDFNEKAVNWGRTQKGLDIQCASVYDLEFPEASFDAIIFDMVLEHVHRPEILLAKITKWLKPGGQMLFCIPYFEGAEFKLFERYAYGLQLPAHLYFYNKRHLRKLLKDYRDVEFRFQHVERDITAPASYIAEERNSAFYRFIAKNKLLRLAAFKPLAFVFAILHRSSRVTVRAVKA